MGPCLPACWLAGLPACFPACLPGLGLLLPPKWVGEGSRPGGGRKSLLGGCREEGRGAFRPRPGLVAGKGSGVSVKRGEGLGVGGRRKVGLGPWLASAAVCVFVGRWLVRAEFSEEGRRSTGPRKGGRGVCGAGPWPSQASPLPRITDRQRLFPGKRHLIPPSVGIKLAVSFSLPIHPHGVSIFSNKVADNSSLLGHFNLETTPPKKNPHPV